ncbi:MAG TPA: hypothetical protein VH302_02220, partial [Bryobacteraceae bacterium]|nr:hypothetical protein [Bryobacteraceae bacterium]
MFQRLAHYYCALPVWDYWRTAENLTAYKQFHVATLWQQHNEHRIILPELIYAADALLMHARQILPIACSVVFYLGAFAVIAASFWSDGRISVLNRIIAVMLAAIVVLWQGIATVLADAFLLQWTLLQIAVACALT